MTAAPCRYGGLRPTAAWRVPTGANAARRAGASAARSARPSASSRARKVRRIIRHVDPWSVLKVSLIFYFCLYVAVMVAGVVLWKLASSAGTIGDIEGFVRDLGAYESWEFRGGLIFQASALGGLVLVVAGSGLNVLVAVLFNLISDLVGGIRLTVIEEETTRRGAGSIGLNRVSLIGSASGAVAQSVRAHP